MDIGVKYRCIDETEYNKERKEFYLSQTEDYIARQSTSQVTLRNCSQEASFSAQFYILSEQTLNKSGMHIFKISQKKKNPTRPQWVNMTFVPGREGSSIGVPGRGTFNPSF